MAILVGRESEFTRLQRYLSDKEKGSVKVLCIEGEAGIGKTLLADKLCDTDIARKRFSAVHRVSAYDSTWDQIIRSLGYEVFGTLHTKATTQELQSQIVSKAKRVNFIVCIDNFDNKNLFKELRSLIADWKDVPNSVLLLTGQQFEKFNCSYCKRETLRGLKDPSAIANLIGDQLSSLLEEKIQYRKRVDKVTQGNPQKLLYLRWRGSKTGDELMKFLYRFEKDEKNKKTETAMEAIRTGLIRIKVPVEHFLSLSNLRQPVFDGTVLAFLWDRLGGGGTEFFEYSLSRLLHEGLLDMRESSIDATKRVPGSLIRYRINTTLHSRLQKAFLELVIPERQAQIQFFLGEYFRTRFASAYESFIQHRKKMHPERQIQFPIEDLDAYVYHTIAGGHIESAYQYLFSRGILEWAHAAGSSLGLKQILQMLEGAINGVLSDVRRPFKTDFQKRLRRLRSNAKTLAHDIRQQPGALTGAVHYHLEGINNSISDDQIAGKTVWGSAAKLEAMAASVSAALGRTCKDLNHHDEALKHLNSATDKLKQPHIEKELDMLNATRLPADIAHYKGIVYSVTGRSAECLEAYFDGIKYASERGCFNSRDALSMGYLSYELKFFDINAALELASEAVDQARQMKAETVHAKNLCTLGQIQSFMRQTKESVRSFEDAKDVLGGKDIREYCRILVDSSVNHIFREDYREAKSQLDEVTRSFGKTGDRRRIEIAKAYLGIIKFREGKTNKALKDVAEAFREHCRLNTIREAIYEAMTYLWMKTDKRFPTQEGTLAEDLDSVSGDDDIPDDILKFLSNLKPAWLAYERFWRKYYLPTLLIPRI